MARLPNQVDSEHAGLLEQIARCRRLAKQVHDQATSERPLALAAEYEQRFKTRSPGEVGSVGIGTFISP
jgi:hypothetical protein